jgi:hypothetical protein
VRQRYGARGLLGNYHGDQKSCFRFRRSDHPSEKEAARQAGMSHSTYRRRIAAGTGPKRVRITDRVHCTTPRFLREWREANTIDPNTAA